MIAQQQCCGPLQLTVADVAVAAQSHFGLTGMATAIGEQSIKMLVDPAAGARMAVGEALTNLSSGQSWKTWTQVKCSANWMWAPKLPGEGAAIRDAAVAMRDAMVQLGIAVDGGKDSLSMATMVGGETVKSPRELVISALCGDAGYYEKDHPGYQRSRISICSLSILSGGKNRLGGSALAQVHSQIGDCPPDMDDPTCSGADFMAIQELIAKGLSGPVMTARMAVLLPPCWRWPSAVIAGSGLI